MKSTSRPRRQNNGSQQTFSKIHKTDSEIRTRNSRSTPETRQHSQRQISRSKPRSGKTNRIGAIKVRSNNSDKSGSCNRSRRTKPNGTASNNNRPGSNKFNSNESSKTKDLCSNGILPKYTNSRLSGNPIAHTTGSLSIAPGSNAAVTTAIAFQTPASMNITAEITIS